MTPFVAPVIRRLAVIFCWVVGLLLVPGVILADVQKGMEAVHQKDYASAYEIFKELAEKGDAEAQHNLGILIREGKGVTADASQAVIWFKKAADQGLADAQYNLGNMYEFGLGVEQSYELAANWYIKAAEKGHPSAQTNLGVLYANGQGVNQDIIMAYVWSNLAAAQGVMEALQNREIVAESMSPEMLQRVRTVSREYFQKYVAPYQPEQSKQPVGHPRLPPPPESE